ncbi:MAG TPA: hypothetical protein PKL77_07320 [Candidatus Omnitrophota bacterium]|nr:hypothetical protein [Candidatus Omnitrophota bacterium]
MSGEMVVLENDGQLPVQTVREQVNAIQDLMKEVMKENEHYGVIPGTNGKPSLLKAGAEKLGFMFRLAASYEITEKAHDMGHVEFIVRCKITHIESGRYLGEGVGSASTLESKYRYRKAAKVCPSCGGEFIIKGKEEYGGGWICYKAKGGCGAKFADNDLSITSQGGRVENTDIADCYNTVLKMAKKRAHVDAMLTVTAASDIFTQDIEDYGGIEPITKIDTPEPSASQSAEAKPVSKPATDAPQRQQSSGSVVAEGELIPADYWKKSQAEKQAMLAPGCKAEKLNGKWICVRKQAS